jgi:hypothetical protein
MPIYANSAPVDVSNVPPTVVLGYLYPPAPLIPIRALSILPYHIGATLFAVGGVLSLWIALSALIETQYRLTWPRRLLLGWVLCGLHPVWYAFRLGQITPYLAALVTLSAVGLEKRDSQGWTLWTGATVALAAFVKPYLLAAGAHLLPPRQRRLIGSIVAVGVVVVLSVVVFGIGTHQAYLAALLDRGSASTLHPASEWHAGYFEPLAWTGPLAWLFRAGVVIVVIAFASIRDETIYADRAAFAAGVAAVPLAAPHLFATDLVVLLPAAILLGFNERRYWSWIGVAIVCIAYQAPTVRWLATDLSGTAVAGWGANLGSSLPVYILQPALWASIGLLALALVQLRRSVDLRSWVRKISV